MTNDIEPETEHQQDLINNLRRRLCILEKQRKKFGELHVPTHVVTDIEEIKEGIEQAQAAIRRLRRAPLNDGNPYRGLLPFREEDFSRFFGRDALVNDLVERVRKSSFLAVLGASGSGKSSVVRAGLLSTLKRGAVDRSEGWRYLPPFAPGTRPLHVLAAELAKLQDGDLNSKLTFRNQLAEQLAEDNHALLSVADLLLNRIDNQRLVITVDQFEELWTSEPAEDEQRKQFITQQQNPFIDLLMTAATTPATPLLIIVAMRADFLHRAAEYPALAKLIADYDVIVSPMSREELHDAIVRPAELAGGRCEPRLVKELIAQVEGREGALPLLEYTLERLWDTDKGAMTWESYDTLGGVEGALAAEADRILATKYNQGQKEELRHILLRLVQPGEGTADARRRVLLADLVPSGDSVEHVRTLLLPLVNARLLVTTGDARRMANDERSVTEHELGTENDSEEINQASSVEVAHEALIRAWPTLQSWVQESRDDVRFQIKVEDAAKEWEHNDKNPDLLWSGLRLGQAKDWLERAKPHLNERDTAFLQASRDAEEARKEEEEAARQRELEQARRLTEEAEARQRAEAQARREAEARTHETSRNLRHVAALSGVLLLAFVLAAGLGWLANEQRNVADQQRTRADNQAATAVAEQQRANRQRDNAINAEATAQTLSGEKERLASARQLAVQAQNIADSQQDLGLLLSLEANRNTNSTELKENLLNVLEQNPQLTTILREQPEGVRSVAFSPDGKTLASGSDVNGSIILWNVATRKPKGPPLTGHQGRVQSVAFSPDGKILASAADQQILLWDVNTPNPAPVRLEGHSSTVWSIAFHPDNQTLASADRDGNVILWDLRTYQKVKSFPTNNIGIPIIIFSPDGGILAVGGRQPGIVFLDTNSFQQIGEPLIGHAGYITSMAFSPDGRTLASASTDETIMLWNVETRQPAGPPLAAHTAPVQSVAFSPDGGTLVSGGDDALIMWDLNNRQIKKLSGNTSQVRSIAFSSNGILAVGSKFGVGGEKNTLTLWNVADQQRLAQTLLKSNGEVRQAVFSPDGVWVAAGGCFEGPERECKKGALYLWNTTQPTVTKDPVQFYDQSVHDVVFSPDSSTLAVAGGDSKVYLWDVATRQQIGEPLQGHNGRIWGIAFSSDGKILASAGDDATIILWDVSDVSKAHQIAQLSGHTGRIYSLAFDPKNKDMLVSGGCSQKGLAPNDPDKCAEGEIRFWNIATYQQDGEPLIAHTDWVLSLAFSPIENILVSGSGDDSIFVWDVTKRTKKHTLIGHIGDVWSLDFDSKGKFLASVSGGLDRAIILWEMSTLPNIGISLRGHTDYVRSIAFNPDGDKLLSSAADGTVRQWNVSFDSWKILACTIANRNLSQTEWNRYIGLDRPYERTCKPFPPGEGTPPDAP